MGNICTPEKKTDNVKNTEQNTPNKVFIKQTEPISINEKYDFVPSSPKDYKFVANFKDIVE